MKLVERSYSGKIFRNRPEIHIDGNGSLVIIATSWGQADAGRKTIQIMTDYLNSTKSDLEVTTPYEFMTCLSSHANHLRIATLLANENLYYNDNKDEYQSGVEILALSKQDNEIAFVLLGNPQIYLKRNQRPLSPLAGGFDLSADISEHGDTLLPPLPNQMLVLDMSCNLLVSSFRPQVNDRLVLLSRSTVPSDLFALNEIEYNLNSISQVLAQNEQDMPFWLGLLEI
jgi:hypothetical protein